MTTPDADDQQDEQGTECLAQQELAKADAAEATLYD
jgi:hypothetical protein